MLMLMLALAELHRQKRRLHPTARGPVARGETTFICFVAYLADGREGTAKIPGKTPGMG